MSMTAQDLVDRLEELGRQQGVPLDHLELYGLGAEDPRQLSASACMVDLDPRGARLGGECACDYL